MSFRNNKSVNSVEEILNCINEYCENNSIVKDTKIKPLSEFEINNLPKLPKDWKWVISNDISTFITNGVHSPTSSEDKLGINKKMLRITDLKDNVEPDFEDLPYCKRFVKGDYDKNIKKNDIYISFTGNILGKRYIVKETREDVVFAHYFVRWQPIVVNPYYIYYVLLSDHFDRFMYENTLGSTQPNLKVTALKRVPLPLAPLDEQNRIATFFNNIDMKIQVNNQINKTLENMAQAIFKQWFMDFEFPNEDGEPYKSSGGEMIASELGMIPEGWEIVELCNIVLENRRGFAPSYNKNDIGIPVINQRCIRNHTIIEEAVKYHDNEVKKASEDVYHKPFDVLINSMGVGTLGRVSQVSKVEEERIVHSCITILRANKDIIEPIILGHMIKNLEAVIEMMGTGSTGQTSLNNKNLGMLKVVLPPISIQNEISVLLTKFLNKIDQNNIESNKLVQIRDSLLPKLMSGKIRVPLDSEGDAS